MLPSYKAMPQRANTTSSVSFHDLHKATIRCRRCGATRDVPLDRDKKLAENYQDFAIVRRAFDARHSTCKEKDCG